MKQTLSNDLLTVTIDAFGAELQEIVNKRTGWQVSLARRQDILGPALTRAFPDSRVGMGRMLSHGRQRIRRLGQHGFARDREFEIITDTPDDEAWFSLESDDSTLALYPRRFRLEIGYRLQEARLTVMWRVINLDDREMSFQIGAHPAFNYPGFNVADDVHGYFCFDSRSLEKQVIEEKGCVGNAYRACSA